MRWGTGGDWFLIVRSVLRVFVDFGEFGVDHLFLRAAVARGFAFRSCGRGIRLFLLVDRLAHLHRALRQVFGLGVDVGGVIALERGLERGDLLLDFALQRSVDLVAMLFELLLGRMDETVGLVAGLGAFMGAIAVIGW